MTTTVAPRVPPFVLDIPEGFTELTQSSETEPQDRRLAAALREVGVLYLATRVGFTGEEDPAVTAGVISVRSITAEDPDPLTALADIAAQLAETLLLEPGQDSMVHRLELPAGPCVVGIGSTAVVTSDPPDGYYVYTRAEAYVPVPETGALLMIEVGTPLRSEWPGYAQVAVDLLESLRFDEDTDAPVYPMRIADL